MDRAGALDWASRARRSRDDLVESLRSGAVDLDSALDRAATDQLVGRIHVVRAVEALPGWGKVASRRALRDLGVGETTWLADVDRASLVTRFEVAP
jgi:hypothetical protein